MRPRGAILQIGQIQLVNTPRFAAARDGVDDDGEPAADDRLEHGRPGPIERQYLDVVGVPHGHGGQNFGDEPAGAIVPEGRTRADNAYRRYRRSIFRRRKCVAHEMQGS
jgi:hypothetical protein